MSQLLTLFALPAERRFWRRRLIAGGVALALTLPVALLIMTHNEGGLYELNIGTLWDVAMVMTGRSGVVGIIGVIVLVALGAPGHAARLPATVARGWLAGPTCWPSCGWSARS